MTATASSFLGEIERALESTSTAREQWSVQFDASGSWIRVLAEEDINPSQGWKLHVSATIRSAHEVLRAAVLPLLEERASFKVAASIDHLSDLNEGSGGLSQVGKFITVYPGDDSRATAIAARLHEATAGLAGPAIPSDRPLVPGSIVHYRYGVFDSPQVQTPLGQFFSLLSTPGGGVAPDLRHTPYRAPEGRRDPFVAAEIACEAWERNPLVANRYLRVSALHASPRGEVHLGADIAEQRVCVMKTGRRHALVDDHGRDACDRLQWEAGMLRLLEDDARFPAVFDFLEEGSDRVLVLEDVGGESLEQVVSDLTVRGECPSQGQVIEWGRELAAALACLHARGLLYRDLKSSNVMLTRQGRLGLVDFESAAQLGDKRPPHAKGTRGYMSPQADREEAPAVTDDVYGLGALLFFAATGAEPSQSPDPFDLLARPVARLNPAIGEGVQAVIERCLHRDPRHRYQSMQDVDAALSLAASRSARYPAIRPTRSADQEPHVRARSRMLAERLCDSICGAAIPSGDGAGLAWASEHRVGRGLLSRDVNSGSAGTVLALAELVRALPRERAREVLGKGASGLLHRQRPLTGPLPGLYVGESGVATAVLRAGQVLEDRELLDAAERMGREIAAMPHASPDVFNGTAGRVRFHLFLWLESGRRGELDEAIRGGERLLETAQPAMRDGLKWTIPDGYEDLSGQANLGYAHGAAGVGDVLLDLYGETGDVRFLAGAQGAARWLSGLAAPVLADGSGLGWPANEGEKLSPPFWCHGATGIGRFFLHLAEEGALPDALPIAEAAGRATARGSRWAGPTVCHGLAGNMDFLLDLYQTTGQVSWLMYAETLGRLLQAFGQERHGFLVFPSERPGELTPDYMVGYAGVALAFLRLSRPAELPHQLSVRAFRRFAAP